MNPITSPKLPSIAQSILAAALLASSAGLSTAAEPTAETTAEKLVEKAAGEKPAGIADLDPRGIYFNRFTGGFPGTEWFTTIPIAGTNRYRLADIVGGGWNATVTPEGLVDILNAPGDGEYSDPDNYILNPSFAGSTFIFNNNRAPYTDVDFPLQLETLVAGQRILAGEYRTHRRLVNAETGVEEPGEFETTTVSILGPIFRIVDSDDRFYQGSFATSTQVGFRVVVPTPNDTRFRTFSGSSTSINQNMLGSVRIASVNSFEAVLLFQTRVGLGSQRQSILVMTSERIDPLPAGDLNGDRIVDATDHALLLNQIGLSDSDGLFNIAADLDGDLDSDADDFALFSEVFCLIDFAAPAGELNFFDVGDFLALYASQDPLADLNVDGQFNFFDVAEFLEFYQQGCP